jgi:hypothetical protein
LRRVEAGRVAGLLFLMRGVNHLNEQKSFDIYALSLRILSILQILFVIAGVITLCPIVNHRNPKPVAPSPSLIEIHAFGQSTMTYPVEADKNVTIEFTGSNFTFSTKKQ